MISYKKYLVTFYRQNRLIINKNKWRIEKKDSIGRSEEEQVRSGTERTIRWIPIKSKAREVRSGKAPEIWRMKTVRGWEGDWKGLSFVDRKRGGGEEKEGKKGKDDLADWKISK